MHNRSIGNFFHAPEIVTGFHFITATPDQLFHDALTFADLCFISIYNGLRIPENTKQGNDKGNLIAKA